MLPVVAHLATLGDAFMAGHDGIAGDDADAARIQARADHLSGQLARHRVAVAAHRHQAGGRYPCRPFHIAVEWRGHRHHLRLFLFEHVGHAQGRMLRVAQLIPQCAAALGQPCVEFGGGREPKRLRLDPDAPAAVLHILLDHAFFATRGDVAEIGVEQVVGAHDGEARVDDAPFSLVDLVDRRFHIVVNAPARYAAQRREGAGVRVEQHLVALARIGDQPEGAAGAQLQVRHLHAPVDATDDQAFRAPIELECLVLLETELHEGARRVAFAATPFTGEIGDPALAAGVAVGLHLRE